MDYGANRHSTETGLASSGCASSLLVRFKSTHSNFRVYQEFLLHPWPETNTSRPYERSIEFMKCDGAHGIHDLPDISKLAQYNALLWYVDHEFFP